MPDRMRETWFCRPIYLGDGQAIVVELVRDDNNRPHISIWRHRDTAEGMFPEPYGTMIPLAAAEELLDALEAVYGCCVTAEEQGAFQARPRS